MVLGLRVEKVGRREGLEYHYKSLKTGLRKGLPRVVGDASTALSTENSNNNILFLDFGDCCYSTGATWLNLALYSKGDNPVIFLNTSRKALSST